MDTHGPVWSQVERDARALLAFISGAAAPGDIEGALAMLAPRLGQTQHEHVIDHGGRVASAALRIGCALGLSAQRIEWLRLAGLLHDVGKAAVPEEILSAARPLTPLEREIVDLHPSLGAAMAARMGAPMPVQEAIRDHHATFADGGLAWARPGPLARIVAVADALVAMTSRRAYAPRRPLAEAMIELRGHSGGQFDPVVVAAAAHVAEPFAAAA